MSVILPAIAIPKELVTLLKSEINNNQDMVAAFKKAYHTNPAMIQRLERIFDEFIDTQSIYQAILSLGWRPFRNRLISVYLYHYLYREMPHKSNLQLVQDIADFDQLYSTHSYDNSSKLMLLGLYLNMAQEHKSSQNNKGHINVQFFPRELKHFLESSRYKSAMLDWMILALWQLYQLREVTWVNESMEKSQGRFSKVFQELTDSEKKVFLKNMLSYGSSTYEYDLFTQEFL
jgi:hypothetical protein